MYSGKYVREVFVIVLVIKSSLCNMNEPRCYSRFDHEEKMLEKMVRTEIKIEELLGKLEAQEKRLSNVETEVDTSTKQIQGQEKKDDTEIDMSVRGIQDLEKRYNSLRTELREFVNTTKSNFDGLEKSLEVHDQRLDSMFGNITESKHYSPVAFFATLISDFTTSTSSQTIVFNNVVTDVGGGYIPGTGVFTAPVNGLYVFSASVTVHLSTSKTSAYIKIRKNGSYIVFLYVSDGDGNYETGVGTVILSLQIGDTVELTCNNSGQRIDSFSFFSGFRL
ncbi:CAPR2-like protein [Mya arenaria]|uniref:CAPR2-like protein n=1 Tax=Mya arenaria TaxID=6604 RepID=A0ABY7GBM6_MYAAR|nr:uncharacterized protein LOC128223874 [Mya arenaria]WAR31322.1 CAPR2-like protein [Mya arenaria]